MHPVKMPFDKVLIGFHPRDRFELSRRQHSVNQNEVDSMGQILKKSWLCLLLFQNAAKVVLGFKSGCNDSLVELSFQDESLGIILEQVPSVVRLFAVQS